MKKLQPLNLSKIIYLLILTLFLSSCDFKDEIATLGENIQQSTENALQDAIDSINQNSASWQQAILDAQAKLTNDAQSTIRNELNNVLQRGIAAAGSEFRCNTDFIAGRVKMELQRILAKLTGGSAPAVIAGTCNVVPLAIDKALVPDRLNNVTFYGYDYDRGNIKATLIERNVRRDITRYITKPTHYHMILNLGGNGVPLSPASSKIRITSAGELLSELAVIQPATPVCQQQEITITPGKITQLPPHTRGDKDFYGHGPKIFSRVEIYKNANGSKLYAKLWMKAQETKKDWTTSEGTMIRLIYSAPSGKKVEQIISPKVFSHHYTDSDKAEDSFDFGNAELLRRIVYRGDRKGKDAGVYTQMTAYFNPVKIRTIETGNCVSASALKKTAAMRMLSDQNLLRLRPIIRFTPRVQP